MQPTSTPATAASSALCRDEEGIKTPPIAGGPLYDRGSALCPDEEGIKTGTLPEASNRSFWFSTLP